MMVTGVPGAMKLGTGKRSLGADSYENLNEGKLFRSFLTHKKSNLRRSLPYRSRFGVSVSFLGKEQLGTIDHEQNPQALARGQPLGQDGFLALRDGREIDRWYRDTNACGISRTFDLHGPVENAIASSVQRRGAGV